MKYGIECEGRLTGTPTLFVDADELLPDIKKVQQTLEARSINHLYVSDRQNKINYAYLATNFPTTLITLDVTQVTGIAPENITFMLTLPHTYWESIQHLGNFDQIKFHSVNRNVLCATLGSFAVTDPKDFLGDIPL